MKKATKGPQVKWLQEKSPKSKGPKSKSDRARPTCLKVSNEKIHKDLMLEIQTIKKKTEVK